jgi:hypothetical protein
MRGRFWSILVCLVSLGILSGILSPALSQGDQHNIYIHMPFPMPYYAGDNYAQIEGTPGDIALSLPMYFFRPMDSVTPRPGGEAMAMGRANIATARGPMAMGWNPAGLGYLTAPAFALDGFHQSGSGTTTDLPETVNVTQMPELKIDAYNYVLGSGNQFGFIGAAAPLFNIGSRPLVGGLAYRRHTEVAYSEDLLMELNLLEGQGMSLVYGQKNKERGAILSTSASLGYQLISAPELNLSLGGSANFLEGRLRSEQETDISIRGWPVGILDFQRDYKGISFELGVQGGIKDDLVRFGGWVSLPYTLEVSNSKFYSRPITGPTDEFILNVTGDVADFDMEIPMFYSVGVAVGPIKGIELSADINIAPWSETKITHRASDMLYYGNEFISYSEFDGTMPIHDVTSYHIGGKFEFPLKRAAFHARGLKLDVLGGYRNLPLTMSGLDLVDSEGPYHMGDQVEGTAYSFGLTLETDTNISFSFGWEFQSYEFRSWFLYDTTDMETRTITFADSYDRAPATERNVSVFRFSTEMKL